MRISGQSLTAGGEQAHKSPSSGETPFTGGEQAEIAASPAKAAFTGESSNLFAFSKKCTSIATASCRDACAFKFTQ